MSAASYFKHALTSDDSAPMAFFTGVKALRMRCSTFPHLSPLKTFTKRKGLSPRCSIYLLPSPFTAHTSTHIPQQAPPSVFPETKQTSLTFRLLYEKTPLSYGILNHEAYEELIPRDTPLPFRRRVTMTTLDDNVHGVSFRISCRPNMYYCPAVIPPPANLSGIRFCEAGKAKFKVTMDITQDLMGKLMARDTSTGSTTMVEFDGSRHLGHWSECPRIAK